MKNYLQPARGPRESWLMTLVAIWLNLTMLFVAGAVVAISFDAVLPKSDQPWRELLVSLASFIPLFISGMYTPRIYGRSKLSLITWTNRFNFQQYFFGAGLWGVLLLVGVGAGIAISGDKYVWVFQPKDFLAALAVGIVLLPIQTAAEELLFRGVFAQIASRITTRTIINVAITSAIFAWPHLANPESRGSLLWAFIAYGAIGWAWAAAAARTGSLEIALGAHLMKIGRAHV